MGDITGSDIKHPEGEDGDGDGDDDDDDDNDEQHNEATATGGHLLSKGNGKDENDDASDENNDDEDDVDDRNGNGDGNKIGAEDEHKFCFKNLYDFGRLLQSSEKSGKLDALPELSSPSVNSLFSLSLLFFVKCAAFISFGIVSFQYVLLSAFIS